MGFDYVAFVRIVNAALLSMRVRVFYLHTRTYVYVRIFGLEVFACMSLANSDSKDIGIS